jgi:GNAT superfamily N-acetyltransferase
VADRDSARSNAAQLIVRVATREDLPAVLSVQRDAFSRVARQLDLDVDRLPPLTETLSDLTALHEQGIAFFVAEKPGSGIVGSVRAQASGQTIEIGRLVVAADHLRQGVATALMETLESSFPDAERFELFTGAAATVPLALYRRRGYRVFREGAEGAAHLVWLEKRVSRGGEADYTDAHD